MVGSQARTFSILLDTNVLAYFYDPRDPAKQAQARALLPSLQTIQSACLPIQVLAEFMHLAPRKLHLTHAEAYSQVSLLVATWPILDLTPQIVIEAARGVRYHSLAYYDAQIWATAKLNQIPVIFSEDFNVGGSLEGVRFVNPFSAAFKLDDWV